MMNERPDDSVWQDEDLATLYLNGVRGAIPLAAEQIDVMMRLIRARHARLGTVLDIGCGDGILARTVVKLLSREGINQPGQATAEEFLGSRS